MTESFEFKGKWKLPSTDIWYDGVLRFSPETGSSLEIFGTFNASFMDRESKGIILGKITEGDITLVDCFYDSLSHSFKGDITIGIYNPSYIIIGHHFEKVEHILFQAVTFRLFNLSEWLCRKGLSFDFPSVSSPENWTVRD